MNHTHEDIRRALVATEVHDPDVDRILGEVNRRAASRRRWQRAGTAATLTVVAGATAGALALFPLTGPRQVSPAIGTGTAATSVSRHAGGLQLTSGQLRQVSSEGDQWEALVENQAGGATVKISLFTPGTFDPGDRTKGERVTVNGRTGYYNVRQADAELAVEQEPDTWLVLSTPDRAGTARKALFDVAGGVELVAESDLPKEERPTGPR